MLGLDYSDGRPSGVAVATAGYGFVVRYLPNGLVSSRVNLSPAEVTDMHGAGVAVALVWESAANRAAEGHAAGVGDATTALAQAKVVGLDVAPIYFAVDFDVPDYAPDATSPRAKLGPIAGYFDGIASVLPHERIGVYGGYWAVSRCLDAGLAGLSWQTVAWSGNNVDPRINLLQRLGNVVVDGVECDINEARQDSFGQTVGEKTMDWSDVLVIDDGSNRKATAAEWITYTNDKAEHAEKNSAAALTQSKNNGDALVALRSEFESFTSTTNTKLDAIAAALAALKAAPAAAAVGSLHVTGDLSVTAATSPKS